MLGERTGLLDTTMERLAVYYEKEYYLAENLRKAVTYPAMMILMLIIILFVLFTRVMPVFSGVYEQLGTSIPPAAAAAIRLGGILSGAALVLAAILIASALILWLFGKKESNPPWHSPFWRKSKRVLSSPALPLTGDSAM